MIVDITNGDIMCILFVEIDGKFINAKDYKIFLKKASEISYRKRREVHGGHHHFRRKENFQI